MSRVIQLEGANQLYIMSRWQGQGSVRADSADRRESGAADQRPRGPQRVHCDYRGERSLSISKLAQGCGDSVEASVHWVQHALRLQAT